MPYFYFDYTYIIYILPAIIISLIAQIYVKSTFNKYSSLLLDSNMTAIDAARHILDSNGLQSIGIEHIAGELTDHYDPRDSVIRLSDSVYQSSSVASIGVAAHEAGHAVQHASGYLPIRLRNTFLPVANFGSRLSMPIILLGIFLSQEPLVMIGILLFSAVVLFQIITLPVEFNASRRAIRALSQWGILTEYELGGAKKVLFAAAMTYVATALATLLQLLRLLALSSRKRD